MSISKGLVGYLIGLTVVFTPVMWFISGGSIGKTAAMVAAAFAVVLAGHGLGHGLIRFRKRRRQ